MNKPLSDEEMFGARNYAPLPVTLVRGEGAFVWDDAGNRYLDMMGAYSAVAHGHCHPRLVAVLAAQARHLGVTSRAFHNDRLGPFLKRACKMTGFDAALPMNTGAEAVETALKAARKWAYEVKGVAAGKAHIIACKNNFHGRTVAIIGMSSSGLARQGFGPFPAGFSLVPFGDAAALENAITPETAAFLVEPIQGEGGIIVPPEGYLSRCARICRDRNVLLICDEIQTGLGRTGRLLAADHENVKPDCVVLGKALGGGLYPVSLFLARREVMDVFQPGTHGSTFGGNPLAAALGHEALRILEEENLIERSAKLGAYLHLKLRDLAHPAIRDVRGRGLFIGLEIDKRVASARHFCEILLGYGILSFDTHRNTVRLAPPLVVAREDLDWAVAQIAGALEALVEGGIKKPA